MGKDLRGRNLPAGICQRKDGYFTARFKNKAGRRVEKYFKKVGDAKKWLEEAKYEDNHDVFVATSEMTVDSWFDYWLNNIKKPTVRRNTIRNINDRYRINIRPVIGKMLLNEVKPLHCQRVLNNMKNDYAGSTIEQARNALSGMFYYAYINNMIRTNPVNKNVKLPKEVDKKVRFLDLQEQELFLEEAKKCSNYYQFIFVLQTGLRTGELIGLKFEDLDFENRTITIKRSMEFRYGDKEFVVGPPKSKHGYRTIPMTDTAYDILAVKAGERETRLVADDKYLDFVFLNRKGTPTKNSAYDTTLYKICKKAGIKTISMHTLRHTFATRCIEAGVRPKALQEVLGHSKIGITMDIYVHSTTQEKEKELKKFGDSFRMDLK